jgi:hypothetical protein
MREVNGRWENLATGRGAWQAGLETLWFNSGQTTPSTASDTFNSGSGTEVKFEPVKYLAFFWGGIMVRLCSASNYTGCCAILRPQGKQSPIRRVVMKKNAVFLKTIAIQLCLLCLQLIFLHPANAATKEEMAKVASVLFKETATYYDYNPWGNCYSDWCSWREGYIGGHSGIDIQTTTKSKQDMFYSVSNGIVITAGSGTYKTIAVYDASRNLTVIYLHASAVNVGMGDPVSVGTPLGKQGDSGVSGAIHVHLEARLGRQTLATAGGKPNTIDPVATALSYINSIQLKDFWRKADPIYSGVTNGFDAQFKLANSSGKAISLESVALSLHDANGSFIKDMKKFSNVSIANGQTWQTGLVVTNTVYSNGSPLPAGTYRVVAKIDERVNGIWDGRHLGEQTFTILANSSGKPNAPTGLTPYVSGTSITLRWNDVSSNESGFRIQRWNGSTWGTLATSDPNVTAYTDLGVTQLHKD